MKDSASQDEFESQLKRLWTRAHAGDERAYREALVQMSNRLRSYFSRRVFGIPDEVEDLVQETLLALHLQRGTYDTSVPVSAWMFAIARHKVVDLLRRHGRREKLHDPLDAFDDTLDLAMPEEQPARRDLGRLLASLPQAQCVAIQLTKLEGLSMAEASERTGVSIAALKVQVHRGLKRLAELVKAPE